MLNAAHRTEANANAREWNRLVIADDDPRDYRRLSDQLKSRGWQVHLEDAPAAVASDVSTLAGDPGSVVVIVDVAPNGRPELEGLASIRRRYPGSRVWAVTAYPSMELAVKAVRAGAEHCLAKPLEPLEVCALLEGTRDGTCEEDKTPKDVPLPSLARFEWEYIARVIEYHDGNISAAARTLRIRRTTLQRRLKKYPPNL